ncbi:MAG: hypothetical protein E6Q97_14275 [Desulfurellales bacterium]|nr:MAG: hypothetical protein E6Q97_14275 [Desulfurellales bacterium]
MTTRETTPANDTGIANGIAGETLDSRAKALLDALNELFLFPWQVAQRVEHNRTWCCYQLIVDVPGRESFEFFRHIQPAHINGEPFRTALKFADEVCERMGRYLLLRPDDEE